jgi:protein-disulfide isomerase
MDRRTFLAAAAAGAGGLAGCLGGDAGPGGSTTAGDDGGTASGPFGGHPGAAGIDDQPALGPEPGEATGTIVAFEDPSCTRCRAFEQETVPKIRSDLVEPGKATFVLRGYPVVYPWGEPASHALEATFARDEDAHWALVDHYFDTQDEFSTDNVLDRTEQFLAGETDVDAAAVVADADAKAYDDQVQADLDAGDAGGADGVTPTVLLFRDGEFRTKARGSVSYSVVESALGL